MNEQIAFLGTTFKAQLAAGSRVYINLILEEAFFVNYFPFDSYYVSLRIGKKELTVTEKLDSLRHPINPLDLDNTSLQPITPLSVKSLKDMFEFNIVNADINLQTIAALSASKLSPVIITR